MFRRLLTAAIATGGLLAAAPAGLAATNPTQTVQVSASLSYPADQPSNIELTIMRNNRVAYKGMVSSRWCSTSCTLANGQKSLHAADLAGDGNPSVVLDLYTGGAHCCYVEQVFTYSDTRRAYVKTERNFGNPSVSLKVIGSQVEFVSADDAFAYAFAPFAESGMPIRVLSFTGGRFHDVTRAVPSLITRDAVRWLKAYRANPKARAGFIAPWAADQYRLGRAKAKQARTFLRAEQHAGRLTASFVRALETFLSRHGY